jgi:hypothetical protein
MVRKIGLKTKGEDFSEENSNEGGGRKRGRAL